MACVRFAFFPPGRLLRPLLTVSRTEIETYAERRALTWSKDESNATNAFFAKSDSSPSIASPCEGKSASSCTFGSICH
ncbi:ATP-binding protein [Fructilactobacillus florum]|uniref:ATP-binding protein n=1 Tax=Fructilactobacillus florum TaxID=640331 RepID=UPI0034E2CE8E